MKFPLKTQETNSDSGGESIIGIRGFCCCGLALLPKSPEPDILLVLPSARQENESVHHYRKNVSLVISQLPDNSTMHI